MDHDSTPRLDSLLDLLAARGTGKVRDDAVCHAVFRYLDAYCPGCRDSLPLPQVTRLDALSPWVEEDLATLVGLVDAPGGWDAALEEIARGGERRFAAPELAAALVVTSRNELPAQPERSGLWADLAVAVAGKGTSTAHRERLAQALAYRGNAVRVAQSGGLAAAEPWLASARLLLEHRGTRLDEVAADLLRLEAALFQDRRRFEEATRLLHVVIGIYMALDEAKLVGRTVLSLGRVSYLSGDLTTAIRMTRYAHSWCVAAKDEVGRYISLVNLTACAELNGDLETARQTFGIIAKQRERSTGPGIDRQLTRLSALLQAKQRPDLSLQRLWNLYAAWREDGAVYDGVSTLLDLGRVAQASGRTADLQRIAHEIDRVQKDTPELQDVTRRALHELTTHVLAAAVSRRLVLGWACHASLARRGGEAPWDPTKAVGTSC